MRRWGPVLGRRDEGFTFVEVLVVIIILAVLALIAIATFLGQREKAERSRAISSLRNAETFAAAIRSDGERYSGCLDDYEREAGANAPYRWTDAVSDDANTVDVHVPYDACSPSDGDPTWVSFAAKGRHQCFYNLLVVGSDERLRHKADLEDVTNCQADDFTWSGSAAQFQGAALPEGPSGW